MLGCNYYYESDYLAYTSYLFWIFLDTLKLDQLHLIMLLLLFICKTN